MRVGDGFNINITDKLSMLISRGRIETCVCGDHRKSPRILFNLIQYLDMLIRIQTNERAILTNV